MSNLLIIEDDVMLNQGIAFNFQMDGFNITSAFTLEEAREKLDKENIDIIILDCNLPDGSGFDFCKNIRQKYTTPIVFLTACDTEQG